MDETIKYSPNVRYGAQLRNLVDLVPHCPDVHQAHNCTTICSLLFLSAQHICQNICPCPGDGELLPEHFDLVLELQIDRYSFVTALSHLRGRCAGGSRAVAGGRWAAGQTGGGR